MALCNREIDERASAEEKAEESVRRERRSNDLDEEIEAEAEKESVCLSCRNKTERNMATSAAVERKAPAPAVASVKVQSATVMPFKVPENSTHT